MKTKLFKSISPFKKQLVTKNNRIKEVFLSFTEELGAWLLIGGFFLGIFWVAQIVF